jgi:hypothetical protein
MLSGHFTRAEKVGADFMSRFRIEHPTRENLHAYAGHDHMLGFFVELFREGRESPIKSLDTFSNGNKLVNLIDCLDFLASNGFFSHESLEDALLYWKHEESEHGTAEALRIVKVIEGFKAEDPET